LYARHLHLIGGAGLEAYLYGELSPNPNTFVGRRHSLQILRIYAMSKNDMTRAFGISNESKQRAIHDAELLKRPLDGWVTLTVRQPTFKEAGTPQGQAQRPLPAPLLHLFCIVDDDPRPCNLSFINTSDDPEIQKAFGIKMGHLFRALGTDRVDAMKGLRFRARVHVKESADGRFYHNYWADRMEPLEEQLKEG